MPRPLRQRVFGAGLVSLLLTFGCAPAAPPEPHAPAAIERDAGAAISPTQPPPNVDAGATAAVDAIPPLPAGANGPSSMEEIVGEPGAIAEGRKPVTFFVNTAAIRRHPLSDRLSEQVTRFLIGWKEFMPLELIDPVRDTSWVVISGPSLVLGQTAPNVHLAYYDVSETAADAIIAKLGKAYKKGGSVDLKVPGVKATLGFADEAERLYVRPQPHVLAIVPPARGAAIATKLKAATVQPNVRPGELLRVVVIDPTHSSRFFGNLSDRLSLLRLWLTVDDDNTTHVNAEGEFDNAAEAESATNDLKAQLSKLSSSPMARLILGGILRRIQVYQDGLVVRMGVALPVDQLENVLTLAGQFSPCDLMCGRSTPPPSKGNAPVKPHRTKP